jgi:hypothetical protein
MSVNAAANELLAPSVEEFHNGLARLRAKMRG